MILRYSKAAFDPAFPINVFGFSLSGKPITWLDIHDCMEMGYCLHGHGVFVAGNKIMPYAAGDAVFIAPQEAHLARSVRGSISEWRFIHVDPFKLVQSGPADWEFMRADDIIGRRSGHIFKSGAHPEICESVRRIVEEMTECRSGYQAMVRGLVLSLMVRLHRASEDISDPGAEAPARLGADYESIAAALSIIAARYVETLRVVDMARACHMSPTNFRRRFKTTVGAPPQKYLSRFRLQMAISLLERSDRSVTEVAFDVGYETLSSFNRQFKKHTGVSPRDWRHGGNRESKQVAEMHP